MQRILPPKLSNAIPSEENRLRAFKTKGRKRAMTGQEAAEAEERDVSHARRRREIEAAISLNNDDVVFLGSQPSQLRQLKVLQPTSVSPVRPSSSSSFSSSFSSSCQSATSVIPSTMPEESEPPSTAATRSSGRVSRPTAKKADTEATATATVRRKDRRPRIRKSRKQDVSQLLDTFSQPTQDIITVTIRSSQ